MSGPSLCGASASGSSRSSRWDSERFVPALRRFGAVFFEGRTTWEAEDWGAAGEGDGERLRAVEGLDFPFLKMATLADMADVAERVDAIMMPN